MGQSTGIRRKPLNPKQLQILYLLYKFRFGTTNLFVQSSNTTISRQYVDTRLRILTEQGYIGRKYDKSYKLNGKPATYHLLSDGIKVLRNQSNHFDAGVLRNIARDKNSTVSEQFINHCICVFRIYISFKQKHGDDLTFLTRSNLRGRDDFPQPLPDAYTALKSDGTKHSFIEYFDSSMQLFVIKKRINYYADFAEDNVLPPTRPFPLLLFVCDSEKLKRKVVELAAKKLGSSWKEIRFTVYELAELAHAADLFSSQD